MTKQEKDAVLIDICRYIKDRLQVDIPQWNMSNIHNGTVSVRRYQRYSENIRLSKNNGTKCVDIHVYIGQTQGAGQTLKNHLLAREQEYRGNAPQQVSVEWNNNPQGDNSQYLVHYYVPMDWENWQHLQQQEKDLLTSAFSALHHVADNEIAQMGDWVNRTGTIWQNPHPAIVQQNAAGGNGVVGNIPELDHSTAKNVILFGPPGTGKTYNTVLRAVEIIDGAEAVEDMEYHDAKERYEELKDGGRVQMITFHQVYGYTEFIGGIRPESDENGNISYPVRPGVFVSFCERALQHPDDKYVFIIDEINRGNVAKIFGELITLIEEAKRIGASEEMRVSIPGFERDPAGQDGAFAYERDFGVPNNVYILGTMNTADRSLVKLDAALRRRFDFDEIMPDWNLLPENVEGVNLRELLRVMNRRVQFLVDREHQIGHAWLMGVDDLQSLRSVFRRKIIPLLQEYFYDDYSKIRKVLNDDAKGNNAGLVFVQKVPCENGFVDDDEAVERFELNDDAFLSVQAYQSIYSEPALHGGQDIQHPMQNVND